MENRLNIKTAVKASGYSGFKADILRKLMLLVMSVSIMSVFLGFSVSSAAGKKSVIDDAGLIKASDEKELDKKIKNIQKDKFDVVILTVKSLDGKVHRTMRMIIMTIMIMDLTMRKAACFSL